MPITVKYQPPMQSIAGAAYAAGLGQYAQRQQQIAQQQANIDADRQMREAQMAMQMQDRWVDQQRAMQNDMFRRQALQQESDMQNRRMMLDEMRAKAYADQVRLSDPRARQAQAWQVDNVKALEKQASDFRAELSKKQLTPEGKQIANDLTSKLRKIQARRAEVFPEQYAQYLGQWFDSVEQSGVESMVAPPPTPDDLMTQRVKQLPDGSWMTFDDKGNARVQQGAKAAEKKDDGTAKIFSETTGEPLTAREYYLKNWSEAQKAYAAKQKELLQRAQASAMEIDPATKKPKLGKVTPPTPEQIWKSLEEDYNGLIGGLKQPQKEASKKAPVVSMDGFDPTMMGIGEGAFSPADALPPGPQPVDQGRLILDSIPTLEELGDKIRPGMIYLAPDGSIRRKS